MGIVKLMDFIKKKAPKAIQPINLQSYKQKILTIDASNLVRRDLDITLNSTLRDEPIKRINYPTDWQGNKTGHLMGIMYRALMYMESDIRTIWVFDGPPPQQKYEELKRRRKLKQQAQQKLDQVLSQPDKYNLSALQYSQRTTRITQPEKKQAIKLVQLIGLPMIEAPTQAQPQCASLVKQKYSYGVVSQDMDTLAFGSQKIIRGLTRRNTQILDEATPSSYQIDLSSLLSELELTYDQFVDFCILCGCDYTSKIDKMGPINAYKLLKEHKNIEKILQGIVSIPALRSKFSVPDGFNHLRARYLFKKPLVKSPLQIYNEREQIKLQILTKDAQLKLRQKHFKEKEVKQDELREFLLKKQFSINRIQNWLQRVKKAKQFI